MTESGMELPQQELGAQVARSALSHKPYAQALKALGPFRREHVEPVRRPVRIDHGDGNQLGRHIRNRIAVVIVTDPENGVAQALQIQDDVGLVYAPRPIDVMGVNFEDHVGGLVSWSREFPQRALKRLYL